MQSNDEEMKEPMNSEQLKSENAETMEGTAGGDRGPSFSLIGNNII